MDKQVNRGAHRKTLKTTNGIEGEKYIIGLAKTNILIRKNAP